MKRVLFLGTPEFATPTLKALYEDTETEVAYVITQPDKPKGRGRNLQPTPIKTAALNLGLDVTTPEKLTSELNSDFDIAVCVAYGKIIPEWFLEKWSVVNVHPSLLPRWRGAAPIQRAIMAGDMQTGVSIMKLDKGLDTGPVYCAKTLQIQQNSTCGELHDELAELGAKLTLEVIKNGNTPTPQSEKGITYAEKLTPEDFKVNWNVPALEVHNKIRALDPLPGARTKINNKSTKLFSSKLPNQEILAPKELNATPGTVLKSDQDFLRISCKNSCIDFFEIQPEGKKRMGVKDFLNSNKEIFLS